MPSIVFSSGYFKNNTAGPTITLHVSADIISAHQYDIHIDLKLALQRVRVSLLYIVFEKLRKSRDSGQEVFDIFVSPLFLSHSYGIPLELISVRLRKGCTAVETHGMSPFRMRYRRMMCSFEIRSLLQTFQFSKLPNASPRTIKYIKIYQHDTTKILVLIHSNNLCLIFVLF